ncbi:MAG: hypothetical protein H7A23_08190 [Leptospiraceae bacterium]|nr:hypothetical protein [Leptospiraceae bacterium]MCP5494524.1 hypothetical protein [Leptospiraceae bacterium]
MRKILLTFFLFVNCSSFQFSRHNDFWDWFKGKPGIRNTTFISRENQRACNCGPDYTGERHPYYLWFRLPEILFNPQGSFYIPEHIGPDYSQVIGKRRVKRVDKHGVSYTYYKNIYACKQYKEGERKSFQFMIQDAGLVEYIFPYRILTKTTKKGQFPKIAAFYLALPVKLAFDSFRAVTYILNDIIKIPLMPIAVLYYYDKESNESIEDE